MLNLSATEFEHEHYFSEKAGNETYGIYVYHNVKAWNKIVINDISYNAYYDTGLTYYFNSNSCPSNQLILNENDQETNKLLIKINSLCTNDFENDEFINEFLEDIKLLCNDIDTIDKLFQVYTFLNEERPVFEHIIDTEIYTDDINDYNEIEINCCMYLEPKKL